MTLNAIDANNNIFLKGMFPKNDAEQNSSTSNNFLNSAFGNGFPAQTAMMPASPMILPGSVGAMEFNFNDYMNAQTQNLSFIQSCTQFIQNVFGPNSPFPANGAGFPGGIQMPNFFGDPSLASLSFNDTGSAGSSTSTVNNGSESACEVSGLTTSENGLNLIKKYEGCRLSAYQNKGDVPTIGYGHTAGVKIGQKITQSEADALLKSDIKEFEGYVKSMVKVPLTQSQFDALVSFTYNFGPGKLKSSTLLKKLNSGDYNGAAAEFSKWNTAYGGKELAGLTRRRNEEKMMFCA